jgi:hypothetical protein
LVRSFGAPGPGHRRPPPSVQRGRQCRRVCTAAARCHKLNRQGAGPNKAPQIFREDVNG